MQRILVAGLLAVVLAGCSSGTPPPGASARTGSVQPSPISASTTVVASRASIAPTSVPTWRPYSVPNGRSAQVLAVAPDGTVYVATYVTADRSGFQVVTSEAIEALGPDGQPKPTWASIVIPSGQAVTAGIVAGDGTLYIAETNAVPNQNAPVTVSAFSPTGALVSGWPYDTVAAATSCAMPLMLAADGTLYFARCGATGSGSGAGLEALGPGGRPLSGWPVPVPAGSVSSPGIAADGTIYYTSTTSTSNGIRSQVRALDASGHPKSGWRTYSSPPGYRAGPPLVAGSHIIVDLFKPAFGQPERLVALGSDGTPDPGWTPFVTPAGYYVVNMAAAVDGTLYVTLDKAGAQGPAGPGEIMALTANGTRKAGWPQHVSGALDPLLLVAPDGSIRVADQATGSGSTALTALSATGRKLAGWPVEVGDPASGFQGAQMAPSGAIFAASTTSGTTRVLEFGVAGQPGSP